MTITKKTVISFLILAFPLMSYASSSAGTTAVPFLKYGAGARAAGMGSAFSSVTGAGSDMIYWNPAGLASIDRQDVSLLYLSGLEGISYGWASYAVPTLYGSFGFAAQYMSSGNIDGTGPGAEDASDFSTYDLAVSLSYAKYYDLGNAGIVDYGANIKYIYSKIDDSASAFAFDAGAVFTFNDALTSFGAVIQNAGTSLKYNEEREALPFVFRIGASRRFIKNLLVTFDLNFPNDNDVFPSFGAEYYIAVLQDASIALRAGYDGRRKDIDGFSFLNAGFGLKYRDYMFDYAFSPYGNLGDMHRVSLGVKLGKEFDEQEALKKIELKKLEREKRRKAEEAAEAERMEKERALMRPEGIEQDYDAMDFGEDFSQQEAAEKPQRPVKKNVRNIAVTDFVSSKVSGNELSAYSEMLRTQLFETGAFSPAGSAKVRKIYSGNGAPSEADLYNILKFTKSEKVITGAVSKKGGELKFEITVYDGNLKGVKYTVTSSDSFRYANEALKDFALKLSGEVK